MKQLQLYSSPMGAIVVIFTFIDGKQNLFKDFYDTTVSMVMAKMGINHRRTNSGGSAEYSTVKKVKKTVEEKKGLSWGGGLTKRRKSNETSTPDSFNMEEEKKFIKFPTGPLKPLKKSLSSEKLKIKEPEKKTDPEPEKRSSPERRSSPEKEPDIVPLETGPVPDNYPLDSTAVKQKKKIFNIRRNRNTSASSDKSDKSRKDSDDKPPTSILKEEGKPAAADRSKGVSWSLNSLKRRKKSVSSEGPAIISPAEIDDVPGGSGRPAPSEPPVAPSGPPAGPPPSPPNNLSF